MGVTTCFESTARLLILFAVMATPLAASRPEPQTSSSSRPTTNPRCADQAQSLSELTASYEKGRIPTASERTGWWVAIGIFGAAANHGRAYVDLDCTGVKRGELLEYAMRMDGSAVEPHFIGWLSVTTLTLQQENGGLAFQTDMGGDANPLQRCRLTQRGTLACVIDEYGEGSEYKQMPLRPDHICQPIPADGSCGHH